MTAKDKDLDPNALLTIGPAAKRVGVSPGWLRLLADFGKIPHTRAGKTRLFKVADLDRLMAQRAKAKKDRTT
jgi:excisionase family DNA binding protein